MTVRSPGSRSSPSPSSPRFTSPDDGAQRRPTLPDLERTFIVLAGADTAFELLSDPLRLPDYVPSLRLQDSIAIEGEADPDDAAALTERDGAAEAGFVADRRTRTMTWGRPEHDYGGSITVAESTTQHGERHRSPPHAGRRGRGRRGQGVRPGDREHPPGADGALTAGPSRETTPRGPGRRMTMVGWRPSSLGRGSAPARIVR